MIDVVCQLTRGHFQLEVEASVAAGSVGLFGPSGAGKSSLLMALAGLVPARRLRLVVDDEVLLDDASGRCPPVHRRRLGLVFQDHRLFPHLDVERNLRYGMPGSAGRPDFDEVVDLLELGPLLPRRPRSCSGGERQRVALGRALLAAPRLLMLDEPLASLDRGLRGQVLPYLRRIREAWDLPMLTVSHDLADLIGLTDGLLLLDGGRAAGSGSLMDLVGDPATLELLHDCGLVFAVPGVVERREPEGLTWVRAGDAGTPLLACGNCDEAQGAEVEILLRPEDVVLALPPLDARTSMTNGLPGRIAGITASSQRVLVDVDCGLSAPLLAEVTDRSVRDLGLRPGLEVLALFKAQATRTRGVGRA